jgi:hypothetical protein
MVHSEMCSAFICIVLGMKLPLRMGSYIEMADWLTL